ncbi:hypothetical protein VNO77_44592 [Canavalia gladiata]|uniref:Uncharacterized protein n=1 Tax=Canavalia gladiata TaxID=3824 RepID=A0AAN9JW77_CANGL
MQSAARSRGHSSQASLKDALECWCNGKIDSGNLHAWKPYCNYNNLHDRPHAVSYLLPFCRKRGSNGSTSRPYLNLKRLDGLHYRG